ncbi:hypothetical protein P691DRAFT_781650 [Macrolepiota fuliginosa MF-IS2]|uniref:Uncharacterized protein n=1 Tax=Macrolepiota fuliginosa MF-IS2 TaxID=1400762 RepID=A0A9P6BWL9_9AGAR|nr:hypothetical protein P691DRAFT_781650 [Macrolepiota fuliginosa MF-IS2]
MPTSLFILRHIVVASENARNLYKSGKHFQSMYGVIPKFLLRSAVDARSTPNASRPRSSITLSPPPDLGITMTSLTAPRSGGSMGTSRGVGGQLVISSGGYPSLCILLYHYLQRAILLNHGLQMLDAGGAQATAIWVVIVYRS